ncbi:hypothetical protein B0T17DRAFT_537910 [Bombardia bombarda]|uniref:Uncharacterized protein n=1 Tax=Bombardia bombarda TaxID=252184 RepID=A0AA39WN69_9PEZI|nr:hypothetical protein B0T17DRAFT_537910 [Bombardia bombarda]
MFQTKCWKLIRFRRGGEQDAFSISTPPQARLEPADTWSVCPRSAVLGRTTCLRGGLCPSMVITWGLALRTDENLGDLQLL